MSNPGAMRLSRRSLMKTFAGIGATSYFTGLLGDAWAQAAPPPRFVVLSNPNGYSPAYFSPRALDLTSPGTETSFTLAFPDSSLSPLEKHKDSLVILDGLDIATDTHNPAFYTGGHNGVSMLTGLHPKGESGTDDQYVSLGPSIDIYLAGLLQTTPFLFIPTGYAGNSNQIGAYRADGTGVTAEYDLKNSLTNWFSSVGNGMTDPKAAAKKTAQQAVVDYLAGQANKLRSRLGGPERAKMDAHLSALDGISRRLDAVTSLSCAKPTQAPSNPPEGDLYIPILCDFVAELFACNLTRVVNISIDPCNSGSAPWLANQDPIFSTASLHNDIAHGFRPEDDLSQRRLSTVHRFYAQQVSYFIDCLKAIPEGAGTAYDNTIILWINELGDPARHMRTNVPFVLAGGGASWAKGRYLKFGLGIEDADTPSDAHTPLLTSIANQFGANLPVFGDPAYPGPLAAL